MSPNDTFDLAAIGSGPGGYVAAIRAGQLGRKVCIIEKENIGGVCLNWGCIPSKALLESAHLHQQILHAGEYGLDVESVSFDYARAVQRSRKVVETLTNGVRMLLRKNKVRIFEGRATIPSAGTVQIDPGTGKTERIRADRILVATGARARSIPGMTIDGERVMTSRQAIVLDRVPESIVIIGAGAIGMEFAYVYWSFGSRVTVVEMMPHVLPVEDEDSSRLVRRIYEERGVKILTETRVEGIDTPKKKGVAVRVKTPKGEETIEAERALVAVGVEANVEGVFGPALKPELFKGFLKVDANYRTSVPGIYAIGDVIGPPWLAHVASHEGIIAVERMFAGSRQVLDVTTVPGCTYCQPQVASVGLTEKQAKEAGHEIRVGRFPYRASGRALAGGEPEGFVKLIFGAKYGELLGAHIVGAEATELIAELGLARSMEATEAEILETIHAHPTLSEMVGEAALAAFGRAIHI